FGIENTLNFQLPVDTLTPWFTPLFIIYISWVWLWPVVIPFIIYLANGNKGFYEYNVNSLFMYIIGTIIYILVPTTTTPRDFIDGTIQILSPNSMFYQIINELSVSENNIWGSFPSYHNFWASLFIFFALGKSVKWFYRYPMLLLGSLISLSTLVLHQHCLMDVIMTYTMTGIFFHLINKYNLAIQFEKFLNRILKI
ncbi:MAG: phosphatase PAP2 family protein, partial [Endomicrobium sp.]|nr:phosphatase PAP2 family protein [Endomicrobium sp.]